MLSNLICFLYLHLFFFTHWFIDFCLAIKRKAIKYGVSFPYLSEEECNRTEDIFGIKSEEKRELSLLVILHTLNGHTFFITRDLCIVSWNIT
jgi:hypothetical protein